MQSQTQTISIPLILSQLNISTGRNSSTSKSPTQTTTTYRSQPVQAFRNYSNNQSIFVTVSSSSRKTTTTTRVNNNSKISTTQYIIAPSHPKNSIDIQFLLSLFSISFKYIFIITFNVLDKLLFIVLNPFETFISVSYKIAEIRTMNCKIEELKRERIQLINQGDQLMMQLNAARVCYRNVETSYRAMKQKRDVLKDTIKALQNELQRERESRFVVEKCHNERIEKLEFEIDMKEQEIMKFEDREKLLKKKIHKLEKKLKNVNSSSTSTTTSYLSLPSYSLQNFNVFNFDDNFSSSKCTIDANNGKYTGENEERDDNSEDYYSSEGENFVFARDSDVESLTDSSSDGETDSDYNSDDFYSAPREIPKDSIYYNFGRNQEETKEEEEEIEIGNNQNPITTLRQEAYNCLYQSLISELCTSSILMDLDVKMDKKNFNSFTCINIILEAFIRYLEAKNQITNKDAIEKLFIRYRPLILNYTDTEEDQMNLLIGLEYLCIENSLRLQQHLRILMAIYKAELVDPHIIIKWYRLLPDEEVCHRSCPMTPSINSILPKLPINTTNLSIKISNEGDSKCFSQMIDGHYATQTQPSNKDNATILNKGESEGTNVTIKSEIKTITETEGDIVKKSKGNGHGGRNGHVRTSSNSITIRRRRSISNISDTEIHYVGLRKDVRELAKFFALWLESKESSSSDEESIMDNMSMSQELDDDSDYSGNDELQRLHQKLLSDEDSCDGSGINESEKSSEVGSPDTDDAEHPSSFIGPIKKCKKVTFNLSHMEEKDDEVTVQNEDESNYNKEKRISLEKDCPLLACLQKNPLGICNSFEFSEDEEEDSEIEEEEIIEEVKEVIEEEEIVEEIYEDEINNDEEDESVTVVEEKEEIIDEVVECIKVTC